MASIFNRLSLKTPPPRVVFLPDALFFSRTIPIAEGATLSDVNAQAELALESLAPFPLAQMYYAHHWIPGARQALIYACYRKRFTTEQTESWRDAEAVIPTFAAFLTAKVEPSTAFVLATDEGLTVIHWSDRTDSPSEIVGRVWPAEADAPERKRLRDDMLRKLGGVKTIIDVSGLPEVRRDASAADFVFQLGSIESHYSREQLDALDVRDKEQLGLIRAERRRDVFLWRAFVACACGVALAAFLEVGLIGGKVWLRSRERLVTRQAPLVEQIMNAQALAVKVEDLSTKRLRPIEMILKADSKRPGSITFVRVTTADLYTLDVEATTMRPQDVPAYQAALRQLPELARVDVQNQTSSNGVSTFHLLLTFKPEALNTAS